MPFEKHNSLLGALLGGSMLVGEVDETSSVDTRCFRASYLRALRLQFDDVVAPSDNGDPTTPACLLEVLTHEDACS